MKARTQLGAIVDAVFGKNTRPIDRFLKRLKEERDLGYYSGYQGDDMMRVVIKWAEKYQRGEV